MNIKNLKNIYSEHDNFTLVNNHINDINSKDKIALLGLLGSSKSLFFYNCVKQQKNTQFVIMNDKEEAAYFYTDLKNIDDNKVLFFPSSYKRTGIFDKVDSYDVVLRTEVLNKLNSDNNFFIISYPEAIFEKVVSKSNLEANTLEINKNENIPIDFVVEILLEYNFNKVDFVYEPGQFSIRGSIIDIYSYSNDYPYRIDFFDNEVDTIRTFDTVTQLSKAKFDKVTIIPNVHDKLYGDSRESIFDYINSDSTIWINNIIFSKNKLKQLLEKVEQNEFEINKINNNSIENLFISDENFIEKLKNFKLFEFNNKPYFESIKYKFNISLQTNFNKNFELLIKNLNENSENDYTNIILSDSKSQIERINAILKSNDEKNAPQYQIMESLVHSGFIDNDLHISIYTDHQIFNRYHKFKIKKNLKKNTKEALTISEINNLKPGDYVVHIDHGIGIFGGLETITINDRKQETVRLVYKDKDILHVSVHSLHRISKYKGKEGEVPKIYKLGSATWQKLKQKTKNKVKDIAKDLIKIYAKRKTQKGYSFSPDSYLQQMLEASFIYEDTPDQFKATNDVKTDMENNKPMDRLICGDVGFGKTEVALRAAFKAVADSKQVALLVPTTILAFQHYKTFTERLAEFPCNIDYLNRFRTTKQQKETVKNLTNGKIDIIIGTHRIVSKDIKYKDLGLLIIDEEQKFGVSIKEKLKQIKANVDTLTLTATPIPRTLQFSLMGARDLSIINTAPPNRYPILTELHTFNDEIIKEVINYEIERNGQVFFINNRIQNIYELENLINRLCPNVRTAVVHGRVKGTELEKIMLDFINQKFGVLLATTIIESGLDIPNANTIIINDAQNFGLSDLHQLRGRVGRSNKKAFCYLLTPSPNLLTNQARRRLNALENFSELGSGFNIALQDLDIRGAGNMLGSEQSGFIADIGFETYHKILDEAILELKEKEYKKLFSENTETTENVITNNDIQYVSDCIIDTDFELLFPDDYIENISERLKIYKTLDNITDINDLEAFKTELIDRFGAMPKQSIELLDVVKLRRNAINIGFERIILKNSIMRCFFVSNKESSFYNSQLFIKTIEFVQFYNKKCEMKERNEKLSIRFLNISNINDALKTINIMLRFVNNTPKNL